MPLGNTARCKQHMHRVPAHILWRLHHIQAMIVKQHAVLHIIYTVDLFKFRMRPARTNFLTDIVAHDLECLGCAMFKTV